MMSKAYHILAVGSGKHCADALKEVFQQETFTELPKVIVPESDTKKRLENFNTKRKEEQCQNTKQFQRK